ncbi:hypothetical protein C900_00311 [Fulvivirga imtechensis AK7]|uniref:Outer membrane protein beta-barrel domain-containing protein n=1 Tax=Fulvivirga imtechensis AK7 TaxID=1237149 RepID=L8JM59_9BACT|nr:hypothetical protein [Fulvivirga imtechensis]ELR68477.1 hypothetical protein C900_00311 [Fulvivirga imtechensis AK7]
MFRIVPVAGLIVVLICSPAESQHLDGGFGYGYFGAAWNISPDIQQDIENRAFLGPGFSFDLPGRLLGGGGYGLFYNRMLLGGSGFAYRISGATNRGEATLSQGGGFVNIGYITLLKDNIFGFPYVGIGGYSINLRLKNYTSDESFELGNQLVEPGGYMDLTTRGISIEAGYSLKFLTFSLAGPGSRGGFMIGVQVGTFISAFNSGWNEENTGDEIAMLSKPGTFAPYLRVTIGGGGFHYEGSD